MRPEPLDERRLLAILESEETDAVGYYRGEIAQDQEEALEYYFGKPFGDEVEGRSQVVSLDVREAVEWLTPDMARIFMSGDHVAEFEPADIDELEDEEAIEAAIEDAKDATEYANRAFMRDNPGFQLWQDWAKDGGIQKLGTMRVDWEEPDWKHPERHTNVNTAQLMALQEQEEAGRVEILDHEEREVPADEVFFDGFAHDIQFRRMRPYGRAVITGVAPEEFLIKRASRSLEDAAYKAHRTYKTLSELMEEFPEKADELWETLPSDDDEDLDTRKQTRFSDEDYYPDDDPTPIDRASAVIKFLDEYIRVDYDGDGITEFRNVKRAGQIILFNEEVDEDPFVDWCPIRVPHKFYGLSIADDTMDIQRIKSVLWRSALDSTYQQVGGRTLVIDGKVNMDDLLTVRPGPVRVDSTVTDVASVAMPLQTPDVTPSVLTMLEYVDQESEGRTGISRYSQGLDPDSLNKTATGIQLLQNASNGRKELIARNMAHGLQKLYRKILRTLVRNDASKRILRLKDGQYKLMDPAKWNPDMDVKVHVGLGTGSREQQLANLGFITSKQEQVMMNAGPGNPLVNWDNLYASYTELAEIAGFQGPERFFSDPKDAPPQEPQPDPEVEKEKIKAESEQRKAQMQMQIEQYKADIQQRMDEAKARLDGELKAAEIQADREQAILKYQEEMQQLEAELGLKWRMFLAEMEMKREFHDKEMALKRQQGMEAEVGKIEQARIKTEVKPGGEPG